MGHHEKDDAFAGESGMVGAGQGAPDVDGSVGVFLIGKAEVCVQLAFGAVFSGKIDDLVFARLQRDIRQCPLIQVLSVVREKITQKRDRLAGEIFQFKDS